MLLASPRASCVPKRLAAAAAIVLFLQGVGDVRADNNDTGSVGVSGEVLTPIAITNVTALQTGNVVKPSAGSLTSVSIPANGDPPIYSTGALPGTNPGTSAPSTVDVSGQPSFTYGVTCPFFAQDAGGNLQFVPLCPASGALDPSGTDSFNIGGILTVSTGAPVGPFSFNIDVTVTYN